MLTISICDDRPLCRLLLEEFIHFYEEEKGLIFEIYQFGSGEELLEELNKRGLIFDLLFLDNNMKRLTGLETAKQIRQYDSMTTCSIVFVTSADNHQQFMSVHPLQIVPKPGTQEIMDAILERVLQEKISSSQSLFKNSAFLKLTKQA